MQPAVVQAPVQPPPQGQSPEQASQQLQQPQTSEQQQQQQQSTFSEVAVDSAFADPILDKQALDIVETFYVVPFTARPLVFAVLILSGCMVLCFLVGLLVIYVQALPALHRALDFNDKLHEVVAHFQCIPSDPPWNTCDTFCSSSMYQRVGSNRTVEMLHTHPGRDCSRFVNQTMACVHNFTMYSEAEQYTPCVEGHRYAMRRYPLFFAFSGRTIHDFSGFLLQEDCFVE